LFGGTFAQDGAPLYNPLLFSILLPARQIFSVEKRNPSALRGRFRHNRDSEEYGSGEEGSNSVHGKVSSSAYGKITGASRKKLITDSAEPSPVSFNYR